MLPKSRMRLLRTEGSDSPDWIPQLVDYRGQEYAILSHRWEANANDEVLFADIEIIDDGGDDYDYRFDEKNYVYNVGYSRRIPSNKPGYVKLRGAAKQALTDDYRFVWIDTCCIDKSSSAELSEAINSMFTWYKQSAICYAYLSDVPGGPDGTDTSPNSSFARSLWWRRGWTLQELIAPLKMVFFTSTWDPIGEKQSLGATITQITGIGMEVLSHAQRLESVSVAKRMSWASNRQTTRPEDLAYCLMGIFSVNMPLIYGEGDRAFLRLQQEIMKDSDDESIFAWVDPNADSESRRGLLANHPSAFARSSDIIYYDDYEDREPYVMSNRGLSITLRLSRAQDDTFAAALHCPVPQSGDGYLAVYLKRLGRDSQHYARVKCSRLGALEKRGALETIYVRQSFPTHELHTVLPFHYFSLRHLHTGTTPDEKFILRDATFGPTYEVNDGKFPTSYAKNWVRPPLRSVFRVIRGSGKVSAGLLFTQNVTEVDWIIPPLVVVLGSISNTQIGFDAYELDDIFSSCPKLSQLESNFKPRPTGPNTWIELENYQVRVEIDEPQVDGSAQIFVTDITISRIVRISPLQALGDAIIDRVEPHIPVRINTVKKESTGSRKIWKRLGSNKG